MAPAMTIAETCSGPRAPPRPVGQRAAHARQEKMLEESVARMAELKVGIRSMTQAVETLSGGQRQCVAVARRQRLRAMWSSWTSPPPPWAREEGNMVLELIRRVRDKGLP